MEAVSAFQMYNTKKQVKSRIKPKVKKVLKTKKKRNIMELITEKSPQLNIVRLKSKMTDNTHNSAEEIDDEPPKLIPINGITKIKRLKSNGHAKIKKHSKLKEKVLKKSKKPLILNLNNENVCDDDNENVYDDDNENVRDNDSDKNFVEIENNSVEINKNFVRIDRNSAEVVNENGFTIGEDMLKYLIFPVNVSQFFKRHWEKLPLYIERGSKNYYTSLINSEKLDEIIRNNSLHYTRNVDIVTYENGKRETLNPEGRAIPSVMWDFYANGCSVRILNPQSYCTKLHALISTLQEYFGNMVGANLYLTPPGSQGFAPHYDDIEAFVIQVEGRKHWKLYHPKNESEDLPRYSSKNLNRDELGKLMMEVTLNAGDFLYFRRGVVHEAHTDDDSHSLHITISVYQRTAYVDLFERILPEALKEAARCDREFREGLPLHYLRHVGTVNENEKSNFRKDILNKIDYLTNKLKKYISVDNAADQLGRQFMHDAMPPYLMDGEETRTVKEEGERLVDGNVINRVEFDLDTEIRLLRYHCLRVVKEDNVTRIYYCTENAKIYHGEDEQFLEIDPSQSIIIQTLQNIYPNYIRIDNLPLSDEIVKLQIISDLWERGLIVTKELLDIVD